MVRPVRTDDGVGEDYRPGIQIRIETAGDTPTHKRRCAAFDQPTRRVIGPLASNTAQFDEGPGIANPPSLHFEGRDNPEH